LTQRVYTHGRFFVVNSGFSFLFYLRVGCWSEPNRANYFSAGIKIKFISQKQRLNYKIYNMGIKNIYTKDNVKEFLLKNLN
jgi:hypothetical protein